ncbi:ATP-binding protein [Actinoplanes sp. NPDC024001]|uniref:ATP-binding protein n=1 Tax=Actinoplanes sp. NPDC024001 TaxID=3154598 RepID=UPI0033C3DB9D
MDFGHPPTPDHSVVSVVDEETSVLELAVRGRWSRDLWLQAHRTLRQRLAEHPAGLLLDLRELDDPDADSAMFWLTARARGNSLRPRIPAVATLPVKTALAAHLSRLGVPRGLPVFETPAGARAALADRNLWPGLVRLRLLPELSSAVAARRAVSQACRDWELDLLADRARLVVSELVVNAAEHAGTLIDVTLSRVDSSLHVSVRDRCAEPPRRLPVDPRRPHIARGQGLRLVDAAAYAWGVAPAQTGKTVWAILRHGVDQPA